MTSTTLIAYLMFSFVASITPGPNNLMLLASGTHFGFRRTVPHMLGITFGLLAMLLLAGFGLTEVFIRSPLVYSIARWVGVAYLLWLASRIARAGPLAEDSSGASAARPLGFVGATLFQWVNPKAWFAVVTAFSAYLAPGAAWIWIVFASVLLVVITIPCLMVWTLFGTWLRHWLHEPRRAQAFNVIMALLLVLSLVPMLL